MGGRGEIMAVVGSGGKIMAGRGWLWMLVGGLALSKMVSRFSNDTLQQIEN